MRRREVIPALIVIAVALAAAWVHRHPGGSAEPTAGTVSRVIDGDTFVLSAGAGSYRVRVLGIDTPETVDPRKPVQCFGPQASAYAKHLLTGRRVILRYDRVVHDVYGRLLAYVWLAGPHPLFLDADLVAHGYARTLSIPPNTAHAAQLAALQSQAILAGRGLWAACEG
jgi:micrococcal nuclease